MVRMVRPMPHGVKPNIRYVQRPSGVWHGTIYKTTPKVSRSMGIGGALETLAKIAQPLTTAIFGTPTIMPKAGAVDVGVPGPGVVMPGTLPVDIPVITAPDITPETHGKPVKQWVANGVVFQRNEDGTISVRRKDGTVKTYRPYRPVVFGKKLEPRKLARVAKKHRKVYMELKKLFEKRGGRRK